MLNLFPDLLTYELLSPLLLRVALGFVFINLGYLELTKEEKRWERTFETLKLKPGRLWSKAFGLLEMAGGVLLIIGLYTQGAALFFAFTSLAEAYIERRTPAVLKRNLVFYIFLFIISISLLLTGAGSCLLGGFDCTIDLPL